MYPFLLGISPGVELWDHMIILCLTFNELTDCFPKWLWILNSQPQCIKIPISPYPQQHLVLFCFYWSHPSKYKVVSQCDPWICKSLLKIRTLIGYFWTIVLTVHVRWFGDDGRNVLQTNGREGRVRKDSLDEASLTMNCNCWSWKISMWTFIMLLFSMFGIFYLKKFFLLSLLQCHIRNFQRAGV